MGTSNSVFLLYLSITRPLFFSFHQTHHHKILAPPPLTFFLSSLLFPPSARLRLSPSHCFHRPSVPAAMVGFADLLNPVGGFSPRPTTTTKPNPAAHPHHRAGTGSNPLSISTDTRIPTEAILSHASALLSPPPSSSSPSSSSSLSPSPAPTDDSPSVSVRVFGYSHASISSHLIILPSSTDARRNGRPATPQDSIPPLPRSAAAPPAAAHPLVHSPLT